MNASPFQATGRAATKSKQAITVKMRVTGRFYCSVEVDDAKDEDAIREAAEALFSDADFGQLSDIDGEAICFEDEDGRVHRFGEED